jgi:3-deoxy-D-manno-octulosonic-acid transferase
MLAAGLVEKLRSAGLHTHITTGTQAGMELLEKRLPEWDSGLCLFTGGGFPLDDRRGLKSFFEAPPSVFVAMETEIWPNLFRELESRSIPICVINARLSARTTGSAFLPLLRRAAKRISLVAARDAESASRYSSLGGPNVVLGGNLKADAPPPSALHDGWKALRAGWQGLPVLVAGNTIEGEEAAVVAAWEKARESFSGLRLIIAPRQPRRFDEVARWLDKLGLTYHRASLPFGTDLGKWRETQILLLDTMGELASAYGLGSVALVGGGWLWHGGHNPMEPLYWSVPTIIGPNYSNFEDLVKPLLEAGCLHVSSLDELNGKIQCLLKEADLSGHAADAVKIPDALKGCLEKTWGCLQPFLPKAQDIKTH